METYYLAVDIGASSGRHILGHLKNGKMVLEEIYRFENGMKKQDGKLLWDTGRLFAEIVNGMRMCRKLDKIPVSMSVDTWAVDYVLLDAQERVLGDTYGYRDGRTVGMDEEVYKIIPENGLYQRTGIQKQIFNTIYQLMSVKRQTPELLEKAETFLMLPDYFQFLLTGNKASEYTNGTSTQLVSPQTKQWDKELISRLGYPQDIFLPLQMPGTEVGSLTKEIQEKVGFDCTVALCASHDTASAVMAMPVTQGDGVYISSGTWSLMGVEAMRADCSEMSAQGNFTNEGGYEYRFRYLKNIMGLWMIQSVKKEIAADMGFGEICAQAAECSIPSIVDCNDDRFLAPANMTKEVQEACRESGQPVPEGIAEVASVIYNSLARCYAKTIEQIGEITGQKYSYINIVGGGSNADYLNERTAEATGLTVYAGPAEATAIGNLAAQMISAGELRDLKDARNCVFKSFAIREFVPESK